VQLLSFLRFLLPRISKSDLGDRVPCHNYLPPSSRSGTFVRVAASIATAPRPVVACTFLLIMQPHRNDLTANYATIRRPAPYLREEGFLSASLSLSLSLSTARHSRSRISGRALVIYKRRIYCYKRHERARARDLCPRHSRGCSPVRVSKLSINDFVVQRRSSRLTRLDSIT